MFLVSIHQSNPPRREMDDATCCLVDVDYPLVLAMFGVAAATRKSLSHATKKRLLLTSLIALSTFFVFLVELEHIHVVRYHAQTQNRDGPLTVDERLALFKHDEERTRSSLPPLDSIIDENMNIIGDPQPLLDFAIIGFGKCGTSTLMYAFSFRLRLFRLCRNRR